MKPSLEHLEKYAVQIGPDGGAYRINKMGIIVSWGMGWDHVSVSRQDRCPTWDEMEYVRTLFFDESEWVVQFSAPRSKHINIHPNCLHMWRPQNEQLPTPPAVMV